MTVRFLLAGDHDALAASVPAAARELTQHDVAVETLVRLREDPTATDDNRSGAGSFQAVLEVDEVTPSVVATFDDLEGLDSETSAVLAGDVFSMLPRQPGAQLVLMLALRRPAAMTLAACHDYWYNQHSKLALSIPRLAGYQQLHVNPARSWDVATTVGFGTADFDGAAQISIADLDELAAVLANPDVAEKAFNDERNFVDHARSALALLAVTDGSSAVT